MPARFRYSRWDGTQTGFELDADDVLDEIADDVVYHGDLQAALRRILHAGVPGRDGAAGIAGLRQLLERVRDRRQEELSRYDSSSAFRRIASELREIVELERAAGGPEGQAALDLLPPDLAGQVRQLRDHRFESREAQRRFSDLLGRLRQELVAGRVREVAEGMEAMTPEQLGRTKDMLAALNQLLERRAAGVEGPEADAAFGAFMARYGDLFPGNPQSLDELVEQMAAQMAATEALLNSITPEQRAQLEALASELMADMDLSWQLGQLARNLRDAVPRAGWDRAYQLSGRDPLAFGEALGLMQRLGALDQLENLLSQASSPAALAEADLDAARDLLGDDAARSLERLRELSRLLEEAGLAESRHGGIQLTPRGLRAVGQRALRDLFARLEKDRLGRHEVDHEGPGHERAYSTKPYEHGDAFNLDIERTIRNALVRCGGGIPVALQPEDFEVDRTETRTRSNTVVLVDLSLSMPIGDKFLAAKKVAVALHALISMQFPRDYLGFVGFGEVARPLRPEQLPEVSWDFAFGTNMHHALMLARRMLARRSGTRQIVMITDGEPTAHLLSDGQVFSRYPPAHETVVATLEEVRRCTAENIVINTFMLDATPHLRAFVERLTRVNGGRAFFTTPETLGTYVLVDFIEQRRVWRRGPGARAGAPGS